MVWEHPIGDLRSLACDCDGDVIGEGYFGRRFGALGPWAAMKL